MRSQRSPSSRIAQPRTRARKARVFDLRRRLRARDGLAAGGEWIRTSSSADLAGITGFAQDSSLEGDGFELPVPRKLGLRRGRRLALHLGSLNAPAARPRLERDQAAPGFGEEGEHCRRVIKRRATASKADLAHDDEVDACSGALERLNPQMES